LECIEKDTMLFEQDHMPLARLLAKRLFKLWNVWMHISRNNKFQFLAILAQPKHEAALAIKWIS